MGGQGFRYTDTHSSQTDKCITAFVSYHVCKSFVSMIFLYELAICHHPGTIFFYELLRVELMTFGVLVVHMFMVDNFYP